MSRADDFEQASKAFALFTADDFELASKAFALFTRQEQLLALEEFARLRYPSIIDRFFEAVYSVIRDQSGVQG